MKRLNVKSGEKYGKLAVVKEVEKQGRFRTFLCKCDCGKTKGIRLQNLRSGISTSCGCKRIDSITTHGDATENGMTPEYKAYRHAKWRCTNATGKFYKRYQGRGIKFLFASFEDFIKEVGRRPTTQHSIDRIDNDGHYEKGNLRWATKAQQMQNRCNTKQIA